jgi:hypothetical protein
LLFADLPRRTGLAPIYLALAALAFVSLVELIVAAWPHHSAASAGPRAGSDSGATNQSFHGAPQNFPAPRRMRWM